MIALFFQNFWNFAKPFLWSPFTLVLLALLALYLFGLFYQKLTGGRY